MVSFPGAYDGNIAGASTWVCLVTTYKQHERYRTSLTSWNPSNLLIDVDYPILALRSTFGGSHSGEPTGGATATKTTKATSSTTSIATHHLAAQHWPTTSWPIISLSLGTHSRSYSESGGQAGTSESTELARRILELTGDEGAEGQSKEELRRSVRVTLGAQ